ncbi:MAG TPA: GGDEF domain-containing protein [Myxococcales bacterium]|jgi:diguanylate cyclase (GGDEF)-like protein
MSSKKPTGLDSTAEVTPDLLERASALCPPALVVLHGSEADFGAHVLVKGPVTIGREPGVELCLQAEGVSRRHCRVYPQGAAHLVEDLGSRNGTLVNGERIVGPHRLVPGDRLHLGRCVIKFVGAGDLEGAFHARMDELAGTDDLTGLPSRRRFDAALEQTLKDAAATASPLAFLAIDLDELKKINDRHGHQLGAYVIARVGRLLGEVLGSQGAACRFGGDEFVAFLRGHDLAGGCVLAERVRAELSARAVELNGVRVRPTLSIGVAAFPDQARTAGELLARADEALYRAKRGGRDRVAT